MGQRIVLRRRRTTFLTFRTLTVFGLSMLAFGQLAAEEPVTPHQIPRIDTRVAVDGVLDEAVWDEAWTMTLDFEVRPGENTPAAVKTEVLVMHDANRLYVGFRAHDPDPSAIRAHLADRDQAWADDWVGVVLDTFNDERRSYLFIVNPLGVQSDAIEAESSGGTPWDGIWKSAATLTGWGWSAELEIPFSTLRFQRSAKPQVWGFDAIRSYPRNVDHRTGAFPRDRSNNCYLCQAIKIEGFAGVSPGRNLEVVPTLTASRTDEREDLPDGPMVNGDPDVELGLTARWGITPNLTLSGTINPDYSQVEADALQLTVNRPFAIFFPELRPFFMEGADFFETPLNIVYTRMMREPEWGLKLTGKEGNHTVGAYVVEDEITNLIIPSSESSDFTVLEQPNTATVLRYKYDVGNRFTLGAIFTDRSGTDYLNRVAGIDGNLRLSAKDRISFQVLRSSTEYPEDVIEDFNQPEGALDDWAAELYYGHSTRTWMWWAILRDIGSDFRSDLGFMPQVGYQHMEAGVGYQWNATENSWYSRIDLKAKGPGRATTARSSNSTACGSTSAPIPADTATPGSTSTAAAKSTTPTRSLAISSTSTPVSGTGSASTSTSNPSSLESAWRSTRAGSTHRPLGRFPPRGSSTPAVSCARSSSTWTTNSTPSCMATTVTPKSSASSPSFCSPTSSTHARSSSSATRITRSAARITA
jgi:hypothetical protein